ncbi:hypothetical protein MP638_001398 [Amoeboaphelidium occidentale]|nr:hypothetical protein MP638_001398 [Amoeboaphelidium occidentale]
MSERITIQIPNDLRFVPKQALGSWAHEGFIERQCAHDVWKYVQETVTDQLRVGVYLAGPMGVGKSSIMYYVVHKARQLGWFVVYIPLCDDWLRMGHPSATGWYSYFFDAVLAGLQFVGPDIKKKYAYCFPPNNHTSWTRARLKEKFSLEYFQDLFEGFREDILWENDVEVILAFDESQALFENGVKPLTDPPFSLIDWARNFKRGCVFVTATADSPYRRTLRAGHERYILNVGALSDDEVKSWFQTQQFANIAKHPDFTEEFIPEIRSLTGDIPRELVLLSEEYGGRRDIGLSEILNVYSDKRQSAYESRFIEFETGHPNVVSKVHQSLVKFFVQVQVHAQDVDLRFMDTGLAYETENHVSTLNSNATKVFFKLLNSSGCGVWSNEILHELKNLESDNMSQVGLAFERLFGLNLLSSAGSQIALNYYNLAGVKEQRCIQIRHFLTLSADKPKSSWKDYPTGTLVAHSKSGEARLDFIYFGGDCIIFFEVTVAADVSKEKYPNLSTDNRLELILNSVGKWMGCPMRITENKNTLEAIQQTRGSYNGSVEYMVVSSRTQAEGKLGVGPRKKEEFAWLKIMDRDGLAKIFPESHIEKLRVAMCSTS